VDAHIVGNLRFEVGNLFALDEATIFHDSVHSFDVRSIDGRPGVKNHNRLRILIKYLRGMKPSA
jgi:hypothetical protein